jgi:Holliday junction resolvase RusA-like endonuclease
MTISFTVPGPPVTQGSMRTYNGRIVQDKKVLAWRKHAKECMVLPMRGKALIDGPVEVVADVRIKKPKRPRCQYPDTKPDIDKIARAIGDALEGSVLVNDSRIVSLTILKRWAEDVTLVRVDVSVTEVGA